MSAYFAAVLDGGSQKHHLTHAQVRLLEFLRAARNDKSITQISTRALARELGMSRTTIWRGIRALNEAGFIWTYSGSRVEPSDHKILTLRDVGR